jgi:hypothetical protein
VLVGYPQLLSGLFEKRVASFDNASGLSVVARPDTTRICVVFSLSGVARADIQVYPYSGILADFSVTSGVQPFVMHIRDWGDLVQRELTVRPIDFGGVLAVCEILYIPQRASTSN